MTRAAGAVLVALAALAAVAGCDDRADPDPGADPDAAPTVDGTAAHPLVGAIATLATHAHQVSGEVEVTDDRTLELRGFTFDGTGLDVRLYGGVGGAYASGVALTDDLRRAGGYADELLEITLPAGVTLDDFDGVSVWCVPAGASFGDGLFVAP
ncbi:MAG: DM13 domain-containing protein [Kofleriaceae bacterium]